MDLLQSYRHSAPDISPIFTSFFSSMRPSPTPVTFRNLFQAPHQTKVHAVTRRRVEGTPLMLGELVRFPSMHGHREIVHPSFPGHGRCKDCTFAASFSTHIRTSVSTSPIRDDEKRNETSDLITGSIFTHSMQVPWLGMSWMAHKDLDFEFPATLDCVVSDLSTMLSFARIVSLAAAVVVVSAETHTIEFINKWVPTSIFFRMSRQSLLMRLQLWLRDCMHPPGS